MNLYLDFQRLLPPAPLLVGEVISHDAGDQSTVQLPGGALIRVRGQSVAIGNKAFIKLGRIEGEAPDLTAVTIEV